MAASRIPVAAMGAVAAVAAAAVTTNNRIRLVASTEGPDKTPLIKPATRECIVVVGTTGTGKSSTISKYTGRKDVAVSALPDSVTRQCQLFADLHDAAAPVWIDTVGYDDTKNVDGNDKDSFQEVLRFIDDHGLHSVRAVVWTIQGNERKEARLQKQANFINQFKEADVWNNTIILVKQPGSYNLQQACQGAVEAAKAFCGLKSSDFKTLGFTYLDSSIPEETRQAFDRLGPEERDRMLLVDDHDVRRLLKDKIEQIETPIKIIFREWKCKDCGVVGDRRLMPSFCHMESVQVHPGPLEHYHPSDCGPTHLLSKESFHPGVIRLLGGPNKECETVRNVLAGFTPGLVYIDPTMGLVSFGATVAAWQICSKVFNKPHEERFSCCEALSSVPHGCKIQWRCCHASESNEGCVRRFPCCDGGPNAPGCAKRYSCCGAEETAVGCREMCRKCGRPWGQDANDCFKKDHNLVRLEGDETVPPAA